MQPANAHPKLSVVIVCLNNLIVLDRCLAALTAQARSCDMEILAVGRWDGEQSVRDLRLRYPAVVWLSVPDTYTVPLMRTQGITHSQGEVIALLEDDCVVNDGWCQAVMRAHQRAYDAIGGPIEPGNYQRRLDWAIYFCEYARFMSPFSGRVSALPGNNVSYKRGLLSQVREDEGFYEVFFHWQLQQAGKTLWAEPGLAVSNVNHWSWRHVSAVPCHHGRAFAGMRALNFAQGRRCLYAGLSLALPLVKTIRVAREVIARKRYIQQFFFALPWILLFMLNWSLGEFRGYLLGAGNSAEQWR